MRSRQIAALRRGVLAPALILAALSGCEESTAPTPMPAAGAPSSSPTPDWPGRRGPTPSPSTPSPRPPGKSAIIVYGKISTLPLIMKGELQVSLDGSALRPLGEGNVLFYGALAGGDHRLRVSDHCAGTDRTDRVTVQAKDTVTVSLVI